MSTKTLHGGFSAALLLCLLGSVAARAQTSPAQPLTASQVAYTYGLAAYLDADLDEAERELRNAVAVNPGHGDAWRALAEVAAARGDDEAARRYRRRARRADRPPETGVSVQGLPRWEARVGLHYGHDSNPANLPEDVAGVLPDGSRLDGETSDGAVTATSRVEVHPFYDRGGWSLGVGASAHQTGYLDLDSLDRTSLRGFAHLSWGGDPRGWLTGPMGTTRVPADNRRLALVLQAALGDRRIDGDAYLESRAVALAVTVRAHRRTDSRLDLTLRDEETDRPDRVLIDLQDRFTGERRETGVGLSQIVYFRSRDGFFRLGVRRDERDEVGGDAFDAEATVVEGELVLPVTRRVRLRLAAEREDENFDDLRSNPLFGSVFGDRPRSDRTTRWSAAANIDLGRDLWLQVGAVAVDRDIDLGSAGQILDLDRHRTVVTAGLTWSVDGGGVR